ncbi:hypothetical protein B5X24_HaOG202309 [Helicoverpa armigera]|uniref:Uncharacterized protein n=1 Tax=Helicoverpa armigera TaxID=29058 RepID=A0A2W1BXE6_HELAM|nr:hypothetical protein B5X24_HaOG202309 [Helicoverpa armigera]
MSVVAECVACVQEAELSTWTAFLQRAVDATYNTEVVIDNLHNIIAEQRRCVREAGTPSLVHDDTVPPPCRMLSAPALTFHNFTSYFVYIVHVN